MKKLLPRILYITILPSFIACTAGKQETVSGNESSQSEKPVTNDGWAELPDSSSEASGILTH